MKVYILKDDDITALRSLMYNGSVIEGIIDEKLQLPLEAKVLLSSSILRYLGNQLEDILDKVTT